MGECGCGSMVENHIFKLGDRFILIEEMPFCDFCDEDTTICITELDKHSLDCFDNKPKKLTRWMDREDKTPQFFIHPLKICGTEQMLEQYIEEVFDKIYDDARNLKKGTKDIQPITDSQFDLLQKKFIEEFNKILKEKNKNKKEYS